MALSSVAFASCLFAASISLSRHNKKPGLRPGSLWWNFLLLGCAVLLHLHFGVERRTYDAGLVQALGRNHGGSDMQLFGKSLEALGTATAKDEEIWVEQELQPLQVAIEAAPPLAPAEFFALPNCIGAVVLGDTSLHLQVSQLGIRVQLAIDEDGAAQTGSYGDHHDDTITIATLTKPHLGNASRVRIVEYEAGALCRLLEQLLHAGIDPAVINISGTEGDAVVDGRRETTANGALPVEVGDQLLESLGHCLGCGGLRCVNAVALANQQTTRRVDNGSLDARSPDIYAKNHHMWLFSFMRGPASLCRYSGSDVLS